MANAFEEHLLRIIENIKDALGFGYREDVYHRTILYEFLLLRHRFRRINSEVNGIIEYQGIPVSYIRADIIVDDVILEIKAVNKITGKEINQLDRYLHVFQKTEGYLINFNFSCIELIKVTRRNDKLECHHRKLYKNIYEIEIGSEDLENVIN